MLQAKKNPFPINSLNNSNVLIPLWYNYWAIFFYLNKYDSFLHWSPAHNIPSIHCNEPSVFLSWPHSPHAFLTFRSWLWRWRLCLASGLLHWFSSCKCVKKIMIPLYIYWLISSSFVATWQIQIDIIKIIIITLKYTNI